MYAASRARSSRHRIVVGGIVWAFVLGLWPVKRPPSPAVSSSCWSHQTKKIALVSRPMKNPARGEGVARPSAQCPGATCRGAYCAGESARFRLGVSCHRQRCRQCLPRYRGESRCLHGHSPTTQTETGLAVVIGHEVAHALARHGGERMSRSMIAQLGLTAVQTGLNTTTRHCAGIGLANPEGTPF